MMRLTRRTMLKGMATAGMTLTASQMLAACAPMVTPAQPAAEGDVAAPAEATTVRFGMWQSDPGLLAAVQEVMLAKYMDQNPGHEVRLEMAVWSDYWDKLQVQIAGGTAPDVVWMSGAMFYDLQERDAFTELTPFIERDQVDMDGYWSEPIYTPEGQVWAMHFYAMVHALYYNKTMFEEAGIADPPTDWASPDWTWDDYRDAANTLTGTNAEGQPQWGAEIFNGMEWGWGTFVLSNGGRVLNEEKTEATTTTPEFIQAIQFLVDLIHEDNAAPAPGEPAATLGAGLLDNFQAGRVAMRTGNNSRLPSYIRGANFEWAPCVPPRASREKERRVFWLENPFCMTSSATDPDVAWSLLRFIGSHDGQQAIADGKIGMPALKEMALDPEGAFLQPPPENLELYPAGLEGGYTTDLQFTKQWLRWVTVLQQELDPAFLGEMSVEECCENAKREIDKVLANL
jgi:multiple sugar transport system substrate-binding protein